MVKMKHTWFPDYGQVIALDRRSTSYFYSIWVGLTAPLLNLPIMIWNEIIAPLIHGVLVVLTGTLVCFIAGVAGVAAGLREIPDENADSQV